MAPPLKLQVFDIASESAESPPASARAAEEAVRKAAFEEGYTNGWEGALAVRETESRRIVEETVRHLQELSFTFHEARTHVLNSVFPLLRDICATLLPGVAQRALGQILAAELRSLFEAAADRPVTIRLHPDDRTALEAALADRPAPPFHLQEDPDQPRTRLTLEFDGLENDIDPQRAVIATLQALDRHLAVVPARHDGDKKRGAECPAEATQATPTDAADAPQPDHAGMQPATGSDAHPKLQEYKEQRHG